MTNIFGLQDFMLNALLMGIAFSALAGPLGSIMVWRRLAFFGDTIAHSALLGIALSLLFQASSQLILIFFCIALAISLTLMPFRSKVSVDALLAIFSHGVLALGLVTLSLMDSPPVALAGFLFGDILALTTYDIMLASLTAIVILSLTCVFWRPLLTTFISEDLAKSEGIPISLIKIGFAVALGLSIGLLLKTVGALLMTAMLIIPASAARYLAHSPAQMIIAASLLGMLSFALGLGGSYLLDTPTGPMIVVTALGLFILLRLLHILKR